MTVRAACVALLGLVVPPVASAQPPADEPHADSAVPCPGAVSARENVLVIRTRRRFIGAGFAYEDMQELHRFLHREGPQGVIDRTKAYWRLWLAATALSKRGAAGRRSLPRSAPSSPTPDA